MFSKLLNQICWVTVKFPDKSVRVIKTTLNESILTRFGAIAKPGYFYDLKYGEYIKFRDDAEDISVSTEEPIFEDEVINFANRFI